MDDHLSSTELVTAGRDVAALSAASAQHLALCAICRIRLARLERSGSYAAPLSAVGSRGRVAGPLVSPGLLEAVEQRPVDRPMPAAGELWRVGRDEAVLVWVRDVIGAVTVEVVPLVLDLSMADASSIAVPAEATILGVDAAALVSLRSHVHIGFFINRVGLVDLEAKVAASIASSRAGLTALPEVAGSQRMDWDYSAEDRSDLEEVLLALNPRSWVLDDVSSRDDDMDAGHSVGPFTPAFQLVFEASGSDPVVSGPETQLVYDYFARNLDTRLWGVRCRRTKRITHSTNAMTVETFFRASYLDTTVLVGIVHPLGQQPIELDVNKIVDAFEPLTRLEGDVDAVVASIPHGEWESVLLTRAHMRSAVQLPSGNMAGPTFTISGFGLVDTLVKHFEGSIVAWDVLDESTSRLHGANLHDTALRHAENSAQQVRAEGVRARTPGKVVGWRLAEGVEAGVARFVAAVAADAGVESALTELDLDDQ